MNALAHVLLCELYKETKHNRSMSEEFLKFLKEKVRRIHIPLVEEFLKAMETPRDLNAVILFYRKLYSLQPHKFSHGELLKVDLREGREKAEETLRDFLLWNQGTELSVNTTQPSGPLAKRQEIKPPPQIPVSSSTTTTTQVPIKSISSSVLAAGKIEPAGLWKNSSVPTPVVIGTLNPNPPKPSSSSSSTQPVSNPPLNIKIKLASPKYIKQGTTSTTTASSSSSKSRSNAKPKESDSRKAKIQKLDVIDLVDSEPDSDNNDDEYGEEEEEDEEEEMSFYAPVNNVSTSTSSKNGKPTTNNPQTNQNNSHHIAMNGNTNFSDPTFKKFLAQSNGNLNAALSLFTQYRIDLLEAQQMDLVRLNSESTAKEDKARAQRDREAKLETSEALNEFRNSELIKLLPKIRGYLEKDTCSLPAHSQKIRRNIVAFLEQESKALKWYNEPAKAYFRCRAKIIESALEGDMLNIELEILKETLYSKPSEKGVPIAFLEAFDRETGSRSVKGSCETPIEL